VEVFDDPCIDVGPRVSQLSFDKFRADKYRCAKPYDAPAFNGRLTLKHCRHHGWIRQDLPPNLVCNRLPRQFIAQMGGLYVEAGGQVRFSGLSPGERTGAGLDGRGGFQHEWIY
jgi:hypothetical protein